MAGKRKASPTLGEASATRVGRPVGRKVVESTTVPLVKRAATPRRRESLEERAPAVYTSQVVLVDTPEMMGTLRAWFALQRKTDPSRSNAVILRELIAAGLDAKLGEWDSTYGAPSTRAINAAIREERERNTVRNARRVGRGGTRKADEASEATP